MCTLALGGYAIRAVLGPLVSKNRTFESGDGPLVRGHLRLHQSPASRRLAAF